MCLRFIYCCSLSILCGWLAGCAGYAGSGLKPGLATRDEVLAVMGHPALQWQDADGGEQLSFPRGPAGAHSLMVWIAPDGRLLRIENVLDARHFARIVPGKTTQAEVLRLLGPPVPAWTAYYAARNELVWEWLYCDDYNLMSRFDVLFDGFDGPVRTTYSRPDYRGRDGIQPRCSLLYVE